jgi:WD40 repeat protein
MNPEKFSLLKEQKRSDILFSMERAPGSSRLLAGSSDGGVHVFDPLEDKGEPRRLEGHSSYVTGIALAGGRWVSGAYDGRLIWRDEASLEIVHEEKAHARWIRGVVASPGGKLVASVADDMVCRLWDPKKASLVRELRGHEPKTPQHFDSMLFCCAFSPDGKHLATADKVGRIVVWELESGKQAAALEAKEFYTWDPRQRLHSIGGVRSLAFSPDGEILAAGGIGKIENIDHLGGKARLEAYSWRKGERVAVFEADKQNGLIQQIAFEPGGKWLVAGGGDQNGFLIFLSTESYKPLREEKAPMHIHELALDADGGRLFAVGHNAAAVWSLA